MATDELTRRAHLQAAVGMVLVVVLDPAWELGEHGQGIRTRLYPGVVALEGLHESLADAVALGAAHRGEAGDQVKGCGEVTRVPSRVG